MIRHTRNCGSQSGFALLEALVAAAIFTLLIAGFHQGLSLGWRGLRLADAETTAIALLSRELASAGTDAPLEEGQTKGQAADGLFWQRTVRAYDDRETEESATRYHGFWVTVAVSWQDGVWGGARVLEATTLKFRRRQR